MALSLVAFIGRPRRAQSWADASLRAGLLYYPKLLVGVPFTPAAGARVLIDPALDTTFGVPLPLSAADVSTALDDLQQRVGAVLVTSPTYEGLCGDVSAIAKVNLLFPVTWALLSPVFGKSLCQCAGIRAIVLIL